MENENKADSLLALDTANKLDNIKDLTAEIRGFGSKELGEKDSMVKAGMAFGKAVLAGNADESHAKYLLAAYNAGFNETFKRTDAYKSDEDLKPESPEAFTKQQISAFKSYAHANVRGRLDEILAAVKAGRAAVQADNIKAPSTLIAFRDAMTALKDNARFDLSNVKLVKETLVKKYAEKYAAANDGKTIATESDSSQTPESKAVAAKLALKTEMVKIAGAITDISKRLIAMRDTGNYDVAVLGGIITAVAKWETSHGLVFADTLESLRRKEINDTMLKEREALDAAAAAATETSEDSEGDEPKEETPKEEEPKADKPTKPRRTREREAA